MRRSGERFSRLGAPLRQGIGQPGPHGRPAHRQSEPGRSEGALVRWSYKLLESIGACALFSVAFRLVLFLVKVIDSLTETGGDIKEGISLLADLQRAFGMFEIAAWALIVLIVFKYRHTPR
ncbi:MAG: hypothetical protein NT045_03675 [Candidatus Aureabacteria bacterium]|nr:hypothetical protein [Candidatus Auribacterota bacterium]